MNETSKYRGITSHLQRDRQGPEDEKREYPKVGWYDESLCKRQTRTVIAADRDMYMQENSGRIDLRRSRIEFGAET